MASWSSSAVRAPTHEQDVGEAAASRSEGRSPDTQCAALQGRASRGQRFSGRFRSDVPRTPNRRHAETTRRAPGSAGSRERGSGGRRRQRATGTIPGSGARGGGGEGPAPSAVGEPPTGTVRMSHTSCAGDAGATHPDASVPSGDSATAECQPRSSASLSTACGADQSAPPFVSSSATRARCRRRRGHRPTSRK